MAKGQVPICAYVPPELLEAIDDDAYSKGFDRSHYIKEILLDYLSKGDDKLRVKLLGREKGRNK